MTRNSHQPRKSETDADKLCKVCQPGEVKRIGKTIKTLASHSFRVDRVGTRLNVDVI